MPNTDTGNYNRFLTSLGLLVLGAALVLPYFYFRNTDVLEVRAAELQKMTATARASIETRQRRISDLEPYVAGASIALFVLGAGTLFFGGRRLRSAQSREDESIERQAAKERYEVARLSASEVEEKRETQARETMVEAEQPPPRTAPARTTPRGRRPAAEPAAAIRGLGWNLEQNRAALARAEASFAEAMAGATLENYQFTPDVKIVSYDGARELAVNGILRPRSSDQTDVLLELKLELSAGSLSAKFNADAVLALGKRYEAMTGRAARIWLVLVIPSDGEFSAAQRAEILAAYRPLLVDGVSVSIIEQEHLDRAPQEFRHLFDD